MRWVQAHHVCQVGQCGWLFFSTHFGDPISRLLTEPCGVVKVLDQMWKQAQDIQRKTWQEICSENKYMDTPRKRYWYWTMGAPASCEGSMSVCRDTVMSLLRRWIVSSCVAAEVKPFRKSVSRPGKLYHFSLACTLSSFSLLSGFSRGIWASSRFSSLSASKYSNS